MSKSLPQEVYWALRDASHNIRKRLHNKLADYGVTWPQYHALYHIQDEGIPANELAKELNCNASNLTGLIDRLMENNWVYREHSREDRRVWLIKLTEEGKNLRERLIPQYRRNIEDEMSVLSEQEMRQLLELLKKLM
ncbi:MAG TPA: MarR family transcriptional regulator [Clostridiales bacterium]|nr:MarR family transcriptional regulator [Clostridiales bacterium]